MLSEDEFKNYTFPGLKKLNEQQIGFFLAIMNGMDKEKAYLKHYKQEGEVVNNPEANASTIMNTEWFKSYKQQYEKILFEKEAREVGWNYDLAILERRRIYALNLLEVERLAHAHAAELEYYMKKKLKAIEDGNENKIDYWEQKIIKCLKSKNMSLASNQACQQALDGLDKLTGLQTVNLNHTGNVNFYGDDMWGDTIEGEVIEPKRLTTQDENDNE